MKDTYALSGSMKTNQTQWTSVEVIAPMTGESIGAGFVNEGTHDAELRMMKRAALVFLWGKETTNTSMPRTSTGLDYEIGQRGYSHTLSGGPLELVDYRTITTEQSKRFAKNMFMSLLPLELYRNIKDNIPTQLTDANITQYTQRQVDNLFVAGDGMDPTPGLSATFDFHIFEDDGYAQLLKRWQVMDDPTEMNANSTSPLRSRGWILPLNSIESKFGGLQKRT